MMALRPSASASDVVNSEVHKNVDMAKGVDGIAKHGDDLVFVTVITLHDDGLAPDRLHL